MFFFFWVIVNVVNFESFDFTLGREGVDFGTLKNASFMILLGLLPSVYFLFLNVGRSMTYFSNLMLKFNDLSREISPSVLSCSVSFGTSPSPSFFFFSFFFWSTTSPSFSCLPFRLFFRFLYLFPFLSFLTFLAF